MPNKSTTHGRERARRTIAARSGQVRRTLLDWFDGYGRSYVWREHPAPFVVLVAEILLRKTTATAVDRFLPAFLERYGDAESLSHASAEKLGRDLAVLGLSRQRGDQLSRLGEALVRLHDGAVPSDRSELLDLPGVGEYTASAILSFAYGRPEAIVDTNVARVLVRLHGITPSRYEARRSPEVWEIAKGLVGGDGRTSRKVNWAILDLGALVCKARRPVCHECPLRIECVHAAEHKPSTT